MEMTAATATTSSIISLLMDEVRQSLEPKISHVLADYQTYKETHDALLQIPFIKRLLENQCKCHATQAVQSTPPEAAVQDEPIHLEIIDGAAHGLPNLDSIAEYINSTIDETVEAVSEAEQEEEEPEAVSDAEEAASEAEEAVSEAEEAVSEAEPEAVSEAEEAVSEAEEAVSEAEEAVSEAEPEEAEPEAVSEAEPEAVSEAEEAEAVSEAEPEAVSEAEEAEAVSEAEPAEEPEAVSEAEDPEAVSEAEDEEEELELFEVEIKGKTYVTNDEIEGDIYEYVNDEVGEIVGTFKNGVARLAKKSKSAKK